MCGALETKPPSGPNTAQEKSRRSLMLVEMEVLWRTRPICSVNAGRRMRVSGANDPSNQTTSRFCSNPLDCGPRTCDAHEAVREDGELDGVELGAEGAAAVGTHRQADVAGFGQAGLTVGLHQDGTD